MVEKTAQHRWGCTNSFCRKTAQIDWIEVVVLTALLDNSADGRGCTDGARKEDIRKHSTAGQALVLVDLLRLI